MSIFGSKSSGKGNETVVQTPTLDPLARAAFEDVSGFSRALFDERNPIFASPDAATIQGLNQIQDRPQSPFIGQASDTLSSILDPSFLDPANNAALGSVQDRLLSLASRAVGDQFTAAGRTGSPAEAISLAKTVTESASPFLFGALQNNQALQLQALGLAPTVEGLQDAQSQRLLSVGGAVEGFNQQTLDTPFAQLERLVNPLLSVAGGLPVSLTQDTKFKTSGTQFGGQF